MTERDRRTIHRRAAVFQLAAEVVRGCGVRDAEAAALARSLERAAAGELTAPRGDPAAAV